MIYGTESVEYLASMILYIHYLKVNPLILNPTVEHCFPYHSMLLDLIRVFPHVGQQLIGTDMRQLPVSDIIWMAPSRLSMAPGL